MGVQFRRLLLFKHRIYNRTMHTPILLASLAVGGQALFVPPPDPQGACYIDTEERDLDGDSAMIPKDAPDAQEFCKDFCYKNEFPYYGLQSWDECFCGNSFGKYGRAEDEECNQICEDAGSGKICGNHWRQNVYQTGRSVYPKDPIPYFDMSLDKKPELILPVIPEKKEPEVLILIEEEPTPKPEILIEIPLGECPVLDEDKIDCGYPGITQDQCEARDCCYAPADTSEPTPWCFKNSDMMSESECNYQDKLDCGYYGITKEQCEARNCCYEEVPGQPYCFGQ